MRGTLVEISDSTPDGYSDLIVAVTGNVIAGVFEVRGCGAARTPVTRSSSTWPMHRDGSGSLGSPSERRSTAVQPP